MYKKSHVARTGPPHVDGVSVRVVPAAELAAHGVWIANWQRMLPVVNATRSLVPKALTEAVLQRIDEPGVEKTALVQTA